MKIIILSHSSEHKLQDEVNKWIENKSINIIRFHFSVDNSFKYIIIEYEKKKLEDL